MTFGAARVREAAQASHVGLVREANEDRTLLRPPILAVADGVGGALAGGRAAQAVVDGVSQLGSDPSVREVCDSLEAANRVLLAEIAADPTLVGMGSTATLTLVRERHVEIVHVGDSRAYLLRSGDLRQLTADHSLVAELVRAGALSQEEAATHPRRNVIMKAIGAGETVDPDTASVPTEPGDIVLVCSDGLSGQVPHDEIRSLIEAAATLDSAATGLIEAANAAGGVDNVSVVLARIA